MFTTTGTGTMSVLNSIFPELPTYKGVWHAIYLEPIVGSGERVTVAVVAIGASCEFNVIQAIRSELLDCLYGAQSKNIKNMIDWLISSAKKHIIDNGTLIGWNAPFEGVICGNAVSASDDDLNGILRQAIRLSASLSTLSLEADRDNEDGQARKYSSRWATDIAEELRVINPDLTAFLKRKIKIGDSGIYTTFGFSNDIYASNFALLVPTNISSSLNFVKAKLLDLETFKKSQILIKPQKFEIIIGRPSFTDPTIPKKSIENIKSNLELVQEVAEQENISVFSTDSAVKAAEHIHKSAA